MSLTEDESAELYTEVARQMRAVGLGWIVDEVEQTIAIGKVRTIKVSRRKQVIQESRQQVPSSLFPVSQTPAITPRSDRTGNDELTADHYSDRERMKLLLESLAQYIRDVNDIAAELANPATFDLRLEVPLDVLRVEFIPEGDGQRVYVGPDMELPATGFLDTLNDIIARI